MAVLNADDEYAVLLPGDKMELLFEKNGFKNGQSVIPIIAVRGYLHEWLMHANSCKTFYTVRNILVKDRIVALTYLMKDKRLLLPPIYADWKDYKQEFRTR
jgi:hypothetical protein